MGNSCYKTKMKDDTVSPRKRKIDDAFEESITEPDQKKKKTEELAKDYADCVGMDTHNKALLVKLVNSKEGINEAFQDPNNPGKTLSYSEMRMLYG